MAWGGSPRRIRNNNILNTFQIRYICTIQDRDIGILSAMEMMYLKKAFHKRMRPGDSPQRAFPNAKSFAYWGYFFAHPHFQPLPVPYPPSSLTSPSPILARNSFPKEVNMNNKKGKCIYIAPFCSTSHSRRSCMDHTVLPAITPMPAFTS